MNVRFKTFLWVVLGLAGLAALSLPAADYMVRDSARDRTYTDLEAIPKRKVGMLMGTSKFVSGRINLFYRYRIEAAAKLYQSGKIDYVLVTGDNSTVNYDEPTTMRNDLVALGIPSKRIVLDYAGFRTLDSVVRADKIFGQKSFTVISQRFHNERAIYLAQAYGLDAIGFNARDVGGYGGIRVLLREQLARVSAVLDVQVLNTQPKFLGDPVPIGE